LTTAAGLVLARFVHFLALSVLLGGAVFPFYGLAGADAGRHRWLWTLLIGSAVLSWASGLLWFALMLPDPEFLWIWLFRLLLATVLVLVLLGKHATGRRLQAVIIGSLVLLASIALTGNSGSNEGTTGFQHRLADAVHLVASGVWIGALVVFSRLMTMSVSNDREDYLRSVHDALERFSGVGTLVVASLTLSGMINPGFFTSSLESAYGQLLLAKLVVFVMMLGLAGANRYVLTPRLSAALKLGGRLHTAIWALRVSILMEAALGVLVLAMVAWLGVLPPPAFD
jgi:copper resistance protein D